MSDDTVPLRNVIVSSPIRGPGSSDPFWTLRAAAPYSDFGHLTDVEALQEDRIHPLRVLMLQATPAPSGDLSWRNPRLLSLHLLAGHQRKDSYGRWPDEDVSGDRRDSPESLTVTVRGKRAEAVAAMAWRRLVTPQWRPRYYFRTTDAATVTGDSPPMAAAFQHVVVEPVAEWPVAHQPEDVIAVPRFRLTAGGIRLAVEPDALPWLGQLAPKKASFVIRLRPDGIELKATIAFPAAGELPGTFLLAPDGDALTLTLLPELLSEAELVQWKRAWSRATPHERNREAISGFGLSGSRGDYPPALVWRTRWQGRQLASPLPIVRVAPVHLPLYMMGADEATGGVASIRPRVATIADRAVLDGPDASEVIRDTSVQAEIRKAPAAAAVVVSFEVERESGAPAGAESRLRIVSSVGSSAEAAAAPSRSLTIDLLARTAEPDFEYRCAHDERALAAALRRAQGIAQPPREPAVIDLPLLSAFIPLSDGWLQVPVPNVAPADLERDDDLLSSPLPPSPNMLGGFLRYAAQGAAEVLSAASVPDTHAQAPWMVTVEGAQAATVAIAVVPDTIETSAEGRPCHGIATLDWPELSMRGFLWISSDRPDAFEALPRIGAGPGAFLDIPLETYDTERAPALGVALRGFTLVSETIGDRLVLSRGSCEIALDFDETSTIWKAIAKRAKAALGNINRALSGTVQNAPWPAVAWRRHPRMPLAAVMPMTRSATSSVRPLESRDLFPFVLQPTPTSTGAAKLVALSWSKDYASGAFPLIDGHMMQPVAGWPFPRSKPPTSSTSGVALDRGVPLAAFGVPGTELEFVAPYPPLADPWPSMSSAQRWDFPLLDEAFATATLPPAAPVGGTSSALATKADTEPPPTASDWASLKRFWDEQERRLQISRVAHSYLSAFGPIDKVGETNVNELVAGAAWRTNAGFKSPADRDPVPYGTSVIEFPASGNNALLGVKGTFTLEGDQLHKRKEGEKAEKGDVVVVGGSPSSFDDGVLLSDARRVSTGPLGAVADTSLLWRSIRIGYPPDPEPHPIVGLASSMQELEVVVPRGANGFRFWFKDVPLRLDGTFVAPGQLIDSDAWQDGQLPRHGFEWRLRVDDDTSSFERFRFGRDRVPVSVFELEPLQLQSIGFAMGGDAPSSAVPEEVVVLARLHLPRFTERAVEGGNLVRVVMNRAADALRLTSVQSVGGALNRFVIDAASTSALTGESNVRLTVSGMPRFDKDKGLHLQDVAIECEPFGNRVSLSGAKLTPTGGGGTIISWTSGDRPPEGMPGDHIVLERVRIEIAPPKEPRTADSLQFAYRMRIAPSYASAAAYAPAPAAIELGVDSYRETSSTTLRVLGAKADVPPAAIQVGVSALMLALRGGAATGAVLPGVGPLASLTAGLLASVGNFASGPATAPFAWAPLDAGFVEGELSWQRADMRVLALERLAFRAQRSVRPSGDAALRVQRSVPPSPDAGWLGHLELTGSLKVNNAIAWPEVALPNGSGSDGEIPYPRKHDDPPARHAGGRSNVVFGAGSFVHVVEWLLDGHRMSFAVAAAVGNAAAPADTAALTAGGAAAAAPPALWSTIALARHTLTHSTRGAISFTSIETLAIGALGALVPPYVAPQDEARLGTTTFGARYRDEVKHGKQSKQATPGMLHAGIGALGTVMQGMLSSRFREQVQDAKHPEDSNALFVAGGFLGIVSGRDRNPSSPLLRLPVIAPLLADHMWSAGSIIQSEVDRDQPIEVAWADGAAALPVATLFADTVTATSGAYEALCATLRNGFGKRQAGDDAPGNSWEVGTDALLAEQSFPVDLAGGSLQECAYFVASAVSVSRSFAAARSDADGQTSIASTTSLLPLIAEFAATRARRTIAASTFRASELAPLNRRRQAVVVTLGEDVTLADWTRLDAPEASRPFVVARATSEHARPRGAILRTVAKDAYDYFAVQIPRADVFLPPPALVADGTWADAGRGYPLPVGASPLRWLGGGEQGRAIAVRDDGKPTPLNEGQTATVFASGVAAMARDVSLPPSAAAMSEATPSDAVARQLVWLSQSRTPIYLPLNLGDIEAPAIPSLSPAHPRVRLPADQEVGRALDAESAEGRLHLQPMVPDSLTAVSVGERAGILVARSLRLESPIIAQDVDGRHTGIPEIAAFDDEIPRFGRAGQAGCAVFRTERTPRPGPIRPNVGNPSADRRPCASPLLPATPLRVLAGPADTVRGHLDRASEGDHPIAAAPYSWSVTFVAFPRTAGVVTDRWDGSIPLCAEIDIASSEAPTLDPVVALLTLLFVKKDTSGELSNRASLDIGGVGVAMESIEFSAQRADGVAYSLAAPGVYRAHVDLVLRARGSVPGVAMKEIADAMDVEGAPPAVELRLTVHPSDAGNSSGAIDRTKPVPLDQAAQLPPEGANRAPVTLRCPLWPIIRSRGALPLVPCSIVFTDPAYDRELASQPLQDMAEVRATNVQTLPPSRGKVRLVLSADRRRVNCRDGVTVMVDLAYERRLDERALAVADLPGHRGLDGDTLVEPAAKLDVTISVQPSDAPARALHILGRPHLVFVLARVYEMSFDTLFEADGAPARLNPGDSLVITASTTKLSADVWNSDDNTVLRFESAERDAPYSVTCRLPVTDQPVAEPPAALYAALVRTTAAPESAGSLKPGSLALPLYAQSPLPRRIDLVNAKADFRSGLMRRTATFVWTLARPEGEMGRRERSRIGVYVVKIDRNGQTYLPLQENPLADFIPVDWLDSLARGLPERGIVVGDR